MSPSPPAPPLANGAPALDALLQSHIADSRQAIGQSATASAIQAAAGNVDEILYHRAFGRPHLEDPDVAPIAKTTPFDIASLTKCITGSILAMQAIDRGLVDWDTPIVEIFPPWAEGPGAERQAVTFLQVLNHSSGLPAWRKFYREFPLDPSPEIAARTRDAVIDAIVATPLEAAPGRKHAYSDLGYLLLARLLERLFDDDLNSLTRRQIIDPLGLRFTRYVDIHRQPEPVENAVATEICPLRKRLIQGTVHDENTNIIGGVSTHAGLFSTASDVLKIGQHLLAIDVGRPLDNQLVSRQTLKFAWSPRARSATGHHVAGWDTPSGERSSAGRGFLPANTVGHLGFTGTSIWIERHRQIVAVLLSNRVYPSRENRRIQDLRIDFQEAILGLDKPFTDQ